MTSHSVRNLWMKSASMSALHIILPPMYLESYCDEQLVAEIWHFPEQLPHPSSLKSEANTSDSPVSGVSSVQSDHWTLHIDAWEKMRTVTHPSYSLTEKTSVLCKSRASLYHTKRSRDFGQTLRKNNAALNTCSPLKCQSSWLVACTVKCTCDACSRVLFMVTFNLLIGSEITFTKSASVVRSSVWSRALGEVGNRHIRSAMQCMACLFSCTSLRSC